jgi:hypothetical protein
VEDFNSTKFNSLNLQPKDLAKRSPSTCTRSRCPSGGRAIRPAAGPVPARREQRHRLLHLPAGEPAGTDHDVQVDKVEFSGDWISAEYWYLGILCAWMLAAASYGTSEWLRLRHQHRELLSEKDKYKELSTMTGSRRC